MDPFDKGGIVAGRDAEAAVAQALAKGIHVEIDHGQAGVQTLERGNAESFRIVTEVDVGHQKELRLPAEHGQRGVVEPARRGDTVSKVQGLDGVSDAVPHGSAAADEQTNIISHQRDAGFDELGHALPWNLPPVVQQNGVCAEVDAVRSLESVPQASMLIFGRDGRVDPLVDDARFSGRQTVADRERRRGAADHHGPVAGAGARAHQAAEECVPERQLGAVDCDGEPGRRKGAQKRGQGGRNAVHEEHRIGTVTENVIDGGAEGVGHEPGQVKKRVFAQCDERHGTVLAKPGIEFFRVGLNAADRGWITPGNKEDSRVGAHRGPWPAARVQPIQLLSIRNNCAIICALCGFLQGISREVAAARPAGIEALRSRPPVTGSGTIEALAARTAPVGNFVS